MTWETFKVADLRLDQLNYRTGPQKTQRDAIRAIITDQKIKLANHARHVLANRLNPGEPVWVVKENGENIVVEGNRRLAALKLMETPGIADGTVVEKAFRDLAVEFKKQPIRELQAWVYPSREEARPWVNVRHMSPADGIGLQPWDTSAKGRASQDQGGPTPRQLAVRDLLADDSPEWGQITEALDDRWTTVDRVLNAGAMKKVLGVTIDKKTREIAFENGDVEGGRQLLRGILGEMANSTFDFAKVEKQGNRETFLSGFKSQSVKPKADAPAPTPAVVIPPIGGGAIVDVTPPKGRRAAPLHSARDTLAPRSGPGVLHVVGPRLNPLYTECKNLVVAGNENAAAFLLRVFIELSSEELLVKRRVEVPPRLVAKNKLDWEAIGISLSVKVCCVSDYLDPTKKARNLQQARLAARDDSRDIYSVWTLHGYFHNRMLLPMAGDIKKAWDAWESYLIAVHENLRKP